MVHDQGEATKALDTTAGAATKGAEAALWAVASVDHVVAREEATRPVVRCWCAKVFVTTTDSFRKTD